MNTLPDSLDQLALDYLASVERGLTGVPADRRRELLDDLGNHIAAERAILGQPTEAALRAILDRLGDPETLAAEARFEENPIVPATGGAPALPPRRLHVGPRGWLLLIVGLAILIVLLAGVAVTSSHGGSVRPVPAPTAVRLPPN